MGFWSGLAKWGPLIGGIAATPFTGGSSLLTTLGLGKNAATAIGLGASLGGTLARGAAGQRAADRGAQADYNLINDRNRLDFANFNRQSGIDRNRQLIGTDLLSSRKAPSDPRAQKFLSGARISPDTIARMRQGALQPSAPLQASTLPQPGKTDSFLNSLGLAGTALDAYNEWKRRQPATRPTATPPYNNVGRVQLPNIRF
jgi:hypothetical protein